MNTRAEEQCIGIHSPTIACIKLYVVRIALKPETWKTGRWNAGKEKHENALTLEQKTRNARTKNPECIFLTFFL